MVEREVAILKIAEVVREGSYFACKVCTLYKSQYNNILNNSVRVIMKCLDIVTNFFAIYFDPHALYLCGYVAKTKIYKYRKF